MEETFNLDLSNLLVLQKKLDKYIHEEKKTDYQEQIIERKLALVVELNELCNETRCFKFWSTNRSFDPIKVLEEYSDGLHFMLSILIYFELDAKFTLRKMNKANNENLAKAFWNLNVTINQVEKKDSILEWCQNFLELAMLLGYDFEQIKTAYYKKAQINFDRQNSGY